MTKVQNKMRTIAIFLYGICYSIMFYITIQYTVDSSVFILIPIILFISMTLFNMIYFVDTINTCWKA